MIENTVAKGVFKFHGNYGFIEGTDLYVRWENINTALNKDLVEYIVIKNRASTDERKKYEAKILSVLERFKTDYVGEVVYRETNKSYVLLDNPKLNKVVVTDSDKYEIGTKVLIKLSEFKLDNLQGQIVKKIGNKGDLNIEILSILEDHGIQEVFPDDVEKEMEKIQLDINKHRDDVLRQDFTDIRFVTIDPPDSKDFDDAIAVYKEGNKYLLYVAIADVWTYLRNSPCTNRTARERGTSIYFLDSVIPMLPIKLSNNYCSLIPNEDRCAIVFSVEITEKGEVLWDSLDVKPGIIHSHRRFSYSEVNDYFNKKNDFKEEKKEIRESLDLGLELYRILENNRIKRGYISIESPEIKAKLDDNGDIIELYQYKRDHAQIMIENFMILANEGIARLFFKKKIPSIYRVHENPEFNKMLMFAEEVKNLEFKIPDNSFEKINQKVISNWFVSNNSNPNLDLIFLLLLRSLQKARYSINNLGHFGLNLKHYLHFTSPIRRYPDAMVHKMLWDYVFEKKSLPSTGGDEIYRLLDEIAVESTNSEIKSNEISKEIENSKIIQFMNKKLDSIFKARVVSPSKNGAFVRIDNYYVEGHVKSRIPLTLGSYLLVKPVHNSKEFKLVKVL
ncbi:ribonuclease R [Candidatus Mycoplasma haematobovis]|uniref:exoribonuclease II n=1 Tax=Candidatus Mycoplasma haematobovis TaxID=432608 RepID=A0A1A9QD07_9MOLU|nr:VacB/RNase II family 3'-5' exoribonuclease [Candidatus Mycoplasma haematobovis]OAL10343.1 ribonuclease R [Candidatus Mycoplasma haematobovis]